MKKQGPGAMAFGVFVLLTPSFLMAILVSPRDANALGTLKQEIRQVRIN